VQKSNHVVSGIAKKGQLYQKVKNKLKETFELIEGINNIDDVWNEIKNSVKTVAAKVLGYKERRTREKK